MKPKKYGSNKMNNNMAKPDYSPCSRITRTQLWRQCNQKPYRRIGNGKLSKPQTKPKNALRLNSKKQQGKPTAKGQDHLQQSGKKGEKKRNGHRLDMADFRFQKPEKGPESSSANIGLLKIWIECVHSSLVFHFLKALFSINTIIEVLYPYRSPSIYFTFQTNIGYRSPSIYFTFQTNISKSKSSL